MNINMEHKNIVATIYLKDGKAIKARDNYEEYPDVIELAKLYNDSGIDKIMIFDLSTTDEEHERNIQVILNINRNIEIKVCAGGNINRMEDIKKFIYAGCLQVIVNGSKPESMALAKPNKPNIISNQQYNKPNHFSSYGYFFIMTK